MNYKGMMKFIKDELIIGEVHVNIGYWITPRSLEAVIQENTKANIELWDQCDRVSLFGYTFSKEFILSFDSSKERILAIEEMIDWKRKIS